MNPQAHWENVYRSKPEAELSWHQDDPAGSLRLIRTYAPGREARIIDVGGGSSALGGALIADGCAHVTVVDLSAAALERARQRAGPAASRIGWVVADATALPFTQAFDFWHDRAVFHFLTTAADRQRYVAQVERCLRPGAHLIIATFALGGPVKCSGLEVCRYDAPALGRELGETFQLVDQHTETHLTPWGKPQEFFYGVFRRG